MATGMRNLGRVALTNAARRLTPRTMPINTQAPSSAPIRQFYDGSTFYKSQTYKKTKYVRNDRAASSYEKDVTPMEGEKPPVNLYDGHYSDHMKEAQTKVRTFTYGEDGSFALHS